MDLVFTNVIYAISILVSFVIAFIIGIPKAGCTLAFITSSVTILFYAQKVFFSKKNDIKNSLSFMMASGSIACIANTIALNSIDEKTCYNAYAFFLVAIDFLVFFAMKFISASTKLIKNRKLVNFFIILAAVFLSLDVISMLLNTTFYHAFILKKVFLIKYVPVYKIDQRLGYQLHLVITYTILSTTFILLFIKAIKSPQIYRDKYTVIIYCMSATILLDAVYIFHPHPIAYSMIVFGLSSILISYYTIYYAPNALIAKSMHLVTDLMHDSVIFFDNEGVPVYTNEAYNKLSENLKDCKVDFNAYINKMKEETSGITTHDKRNLDFSFTHEFSGKDKKHYISVWFHNLNEKKGTRPAGSFFIIHDRTKEEEKLSCEKYLNTHDALTGLYNKEYFYEKVKSILQENPKTEYIMLCSDISNFKLINNVFWKKTGDDLLVRIAKALKSQATSQTIFAHLYNDNFAAFLPKHMFKPGFMLKKIDDICYIKQNTNYPINIYVGAYEITDRNMPVAAMCNRAIMALETIKGNVHEKLAYFDGTLLQNILREQNLVGEFPQALQEHQFKMFLQPQVSIKKAIKGAEALVRWEHPSRGIISPAEFIPLFEKNGIITNLDQYMWEAAAKKLAEWKALNIDYLYIAVNISPVDFVYLDIVHTFKNLIEKYEISPKRLKLEVTESAVMLNQHRLQKIIFDLQEIGFEVEMDDFGSGYSSLNNLKNFNFNTLKIDMMFLGKSENPERASIILESIISLAKSLNMPVISEGVSTQEQVDYLKEMGIDLYQGYYFDKPLSVKDFEEKYLKKI